MAQPATNPKIEELRFKLKTDPKSRLFYQLAEELRRAGQCAEAEQVLRSGLAVYPTYLAAWVSLGRVLREQKNDGGAVEALTRALQLDPGNVVAARLLADAYLALGEKIEAIKKYKLVYALLPADEELRATIEQLERELSPAPPAPIPAPVVAEEAPVAEASVAAAEPDSFPFAEESPFDRTVPPFEEAAQSLGEELRVEQETADAEPMARAHDESPFEEPVEGFTSATVELEAPVGVQVAAAPLAADVPSYVEEDLPPVDAAPVFDTTPPPVAPVATDAADTITMADLYARQGLIDDARHIYENILARDPGNAEVRGKLDGLTPKVNTKVSRLEQWLAKVSRREVGSV